MRQRQTLACLDAGARKNSSHGVVASRAGCCTAGRQLSSRLMQLRYRGRTRSAACVPSSRQAIIRPSITRGPTSCSGPPCWRLRSAASITSCTMRSPGKGAIGIGQLDASANRQFWFGPGVAITAGTRADTLQVGDETVGIRDSVFGVGRVVVAATREGDVLCVHGVCSVQRGRQRHRNRWRTVRGGKDRSQRYRRVQAPPRTARHGTRTDCQPAPLKATPVGKRKSLSLGLCRPGHPFSVAIHLVHMPARSTKGIRDSHQNAAQYCIRRRP